MYKYHDLFFIVSLMLVSFIKLGFGLISKKITYNKSNRLNMKMITTDDSKSSLLNYFEASSRDDIFACPQTLSEVRRKTKIYGFYTEKYWESEDFKIQYPIDKLYSDFTIPSETQKPFWTLSSRENVGQNFFQNPLIPFLYERGYRQNFENVGFPGIDKEFEEINSFFTSGNATSVIMDLSCGSGFMTRRLMKSNNYKRILAADFSPTMLLESRRRAIQENISPLPEFIRCDSAKLPFKSDTLDAIHAGAAMHCWPKLDSALLEIYRVLKPGGRYFASTFLAQNNLAASKNKSDNDINFYVFENEKELSDLLVKAGFNESSVQVRREGRGCAIIKAVK